MANPSRLHEPTALVAHRGRRVSPDRSIADARPAIREPIPPLPQPVAARDDTSTGRLWLGADAN